MAKKIRFPLEMENETMVRSLDELKANFSIKKILMYYDNGKLDTWLRDRYYNDIADKIAALDKGSDSFNKDICKIFDVEYTEDSNIDLEAVEMLNDKLSKLKVYTDDAKYRKVIDSIAFEQEELWDLLDEGKTTIYLCGDKFDIPLTKEGITYIGINNPIAVIDSKVVVDFESKNIKFDNIKLDTKYLQESKIKIETVKNILNKMQNKKIYSSYVINEIENMNLSKWGKKFKENNPIKEKYVEEPCGFAAAGSLIKN